MELKKMGDYDIINIAKNDSSKILEYKISRTEDKGLILEIKMDISDSFLDLSTFNIDELMNKAQQGDVKSLSVLKELTQD